MRNCTFYLRANQNPISADEIKKSISNSNLEQKVKAIKQLIKCLISDEAFPPMIMHIITTIIPVVHQSPNLRKVLLLYFEVIQKNKSSTDKSLKDEMFLACNSLRTDLLSHNEYLRGRTLTLISRIMHRGVIEPLSSAIIANLDHRSSYVRRNAIVCLYQVFIHFGSDIIGDIDEEIQKLLLTQTDLSTKRNAFLLLHRTNPTKAMKYIQIQINNQAVDQIGDILQLAILKVFRVICKEDSSQKPKLLKIIKDFSVNTNQSVCLQCAMASTSISNSVSTIKNSIYAYVSILGKTNQINVKKIILDKLSAICRNSSYLEDDLVEDLVKALNTPSYQIKDKLIQIISSGITLKTSVIVLKHLQNQFKGNDHPEYHQHLINTIQLIGLKFNITHQYILPFISDKIFKSQLLTTNSAQSIINLLKHIILETSNDQATKIYLTIMEKFKTIQSAELARSLLNLVGICVEDQKVIFQCLNYLASSVGSLPITSQLQTQKRQLSNQHKQQKVKKFKTVILADGTYSKQQVEEGKEQNLQSQHHYFRNMIANDSIIGGTFARNIGKLLYRIRKTPNFNKYACITLMILCSLLRYYQNCIWTVDQACLDQITAIIRKITSPATFIEGYDEDLGQNSQVEVRNIQTDRESQLMEKNPQDMIIFRQLKKGNDEMTDIEFDDDQINQIGENIIQKNDYITKLKSMVQLTGYLDPIYAQAFIKINKYDIFFEIMMVNNSKSNILNIQIQFSSTTEVMILQKAQSVNLRPQEMVNLRCQMRFNGGQFGSVYGYINYDNQAGLQQHYLVTQQIKIDYMQFIRGAQISQKQFKNGWQKVNFEVKEQQHIKDQTITFKKIINYYEKSLHAFAVEKPTQVEEQFFLNVHLYGRSKLGQDFFINMALFRGQGVQITVTIKSKDKTVKDIIHRQLLKTQILGE